MSNLDPKKVWSYDERVWACARIADCESALISMVNQFFYSKASENIFRHSFMSAEEEAAEYLVEHGIARWVGKNKSAICFTRRRNERKVDA